ncbi:bestrophin family protein [Pedobacter sp. Leaf170]|uniref:bestrophin family protein n=1 Tax=Pedobacter sp. Leaf170 TaxID=2876558 RepID=UPI001E46ACA7|nr:bestrophin family ion channel [Pedobacter sp. Leaf170]
MNLQSESGNYIFIWIITKYQSLHNVHFMLNRQNKNMLINKKISVLYFIRLIKWDIITIGIYAIVAGTLDHYGFFEQIKIPLALSAFVGTTLSLLLAFRTSQSYERWWEARVVWGAIVNDSRTLIRQLTLFLPKHKDRADLLESFATRQVIWCFALSESLRKTAPSTKVKNYFIKHNLNSENQANLLLIRHSSALASASERGQMDPNKVVQIDSTIARLCDSMGKCERIKNTIFPRSYSVLIHFLIYVLMTIMPFGLEDETPVVEIMLIFLVPILFIMIEKTAIIMQDPFENVPTDTPMTAICMTIERNLMEMIEHPPMAQPKADNTYFIM